MASRAAGRENDMIAARLSVLFAWGGKSFGPMAPTLAPVTGPLVSPLLRVA